MLFVHKSDEDSSRGKKHVPPVHAGMEKDESG